MAQKMYQILKEELAQAILEKDYRKLEELKQILNVSNKHP